MRCLARQLAAGCGSPFVLRISPRRWQKGRSKAQANSLKGVKKTAFARKLREPKYGAAADKVPADQLRKGDIVLVEAGDIIPCDGEVIEGGASVDESAITGESAPVIHPAAILPPSPAARVFFLTGW